MAAATGKESSALAARLVENEVVENEEECLD